MSIKLPTAIASYFLAANAGNTDAVLTCFASDAVVHDEGKEIRGTAAIREWEEQTLKKYAATLTPVEVSEVPGIAIVATNVAGNFDGSPITLNFKFSLDNGLIAKLEIAT